MASVRTLQSDASSSQTNHNARVDDVIAHAAPFAQPILRYLREVIHQAVPDIVEEIKWGRPFFTVNGTLLCNMAAFSRHCSLGFWSPDMTTLLQSEGVVGMSGSGSFGKITGVEDLPARSDLLRYFREAAARARTGDATSPMKTRARVYAKVPTPAPPEFSEALAHSAVAHSTFEALPPSCRREYLEWIASAKRPETRLRRTAQAITMLEAGKRFHEQYRAT